MTNPPPYRPGQHAPTLLYIYQSYVLKGTARDEAAERLEREIRKGDIVPNPPLDPKDPNWRLKPKQGLPRPRFYTDAEGVRQPGPEYYVGLPLLDVIIGGTA